MSLEIKSLVALSGQNNVSIIWTEPFDSNQDTVYYYNVDNPENLDCWIKIGTKSTIQNFNNDRAYKGFLGVIISDYAIKINNENIIKGFSGESKNIIYLAATQENIPISINTQYVSTNITYKDFNFSRPNPDRLLRSLDKKYNKEPYSNNYKLFSLLAMPIKDFFDSLETDGLDQLNILKSEGEYLDNWGKLFNISRFPNESESDYSSRILKYFITKKGTNKGLNDIIYYIINSYNSSTSLNYAPIKGFLILEGTKDSRTFFLNKSFLGHHSLTNNFIGDYVKTKASNTQSNLTDINFYVNNPTAAVIPNIKGTRFSSNSSIIFTLRIILSIDSRVNPAVHPDMLQTLREILYRISSAINYFKLAGTSVNIEIKYV
jgi:hypothetical protein